MPSCAAHYAFGQDVLANLRADLKSAAASYKREYDIGLQGPDIFFFYKPFFGAPVARYGIALHGRPGSETFAPALARRQTGAALSYAMGLVCHYALDSVCHPYVDGHSRALGDHFLMEASFDRRILARPDMPRRRYTLLEAKGLDVDGISELWPGMSAGLLRKCVQSMRFYTRLLDNGRLVRMAQRLSRNRISFTSMSLPDAVPASQRRHMEQLASLYGQALAKAPGMIAAVCDAMGAWPAALPGFELNYAGRLADE